MNTLWKGSIRFGLDKIPVSLYAEDGDFQPHHPSQQSHSSSPWTSSETTGCAVVTAKDLEEITLKAARAIEITALVDMKSIDPAYLHSPHRIEPCHRSGKAYAELLEVLSGTRTAALAKIVLPSGREQVLALLAHNDFLEGHVLHFDPKRKPFSLMSTEEISTNQLQPAPAPDLAELLLQENSQTPPRTRRRSRRHAHTTLVSKKRHS